MITPNTRRHLLAATLAAGLFVAAAPAGAETDSTPAPPKTIVIGTGNAMKPYCYVDDAGNLAGYEIEVLKAINGRLPRYKFEIVVQEFYNLFIGLDSGKLDVSAHQIEKNPLRASKYLYADEGYTNYVLHLVVRADRNDIESIDDMRGKLISVGAGGNAAYLINEYNRTHGNAIRIKYSSGIEALSSVKDITDGRVDAILSLRRNVEGLNRTFGNRLKIVGPPVSTSHAYHIFRKDETQLKTDFDTALRALKNDGTLNKLSIEILGGDYVDQE